MFPAGWQEGPRRGHLKRSSRARSFQVPYLRTRVPRHQETSGKNTQGRLFENVPTSKCNQTFGKFLRTLSEVVFPHLLSVLTLMCSIVKKLIVIVSDIRGALRNDAFESFRR